jgi:chorismate mutase/prephenate dehydratase
LNIFECDFSLNYNNQGEILEKLRGRIDELDAELLALLNERAKCVIKIGAIKQKENTEVLVPQRETELLDRLSSLNQGPMTTEMVLHIFQQIIDTLKELQK